MISKQLLLSEQQSTAFDRFLLSGTGNVLKAFENMFELEIENSESLMEIAAANESETLRIVDAESFYSISSELAGQLRGQFHMLLLKGDLDHLAELLKPVLSLMFLSSSDADLRTLDSRKPGWMDGPVGSAMQDVCFHRQMMDVLAELGNVLIGNYSRSIYDLTDLKTQHSLPRVERVADLRPVPRGLDDVGALNDPLLIIDHLMLFDAEPIHLWCVFSLVPDSFRDLLHGIEICSEQRIASGTSRFAVQMLAG